MCSCCFLWFVCVMFSGGRPGVQWFLVLIDIDCLSVLAVYDLFFVFDTL